MKTASYTYVRIYTILQPVNGKIFYFFTYLPYYQILPDKFFIHVFMMIKSLRLLLSSRISEYDIEKLLKFCILFEQYYGKHPIIQIV